MAYAGKISDMPFRERYSIHRIKALIDQTTRNMPHIQEALNGLLYQIEQLKEELDNIPHPVTIELVREPWNPDTEPFDNERSSDEEDEKR